MTPVSEPIEGEGERYRPTTARRRPTMVEVFQWDGSDECAQAINEWAGAYIVDFKRDESRNVQLWVAANKAWVNLTPGEWVMKDTAGFYPCLAQVFALTYDLDVLDDECPRCGSTSHGDLRCEANA